MNEDKIKQILADALDFDSLTPGFKVIDVDKVAKQIADLYEPPEDLLLSDGEICLAICGDTEEVAACEECTDILDEQEIAKAQAAKAKLYYEAKYLKELI